MKNLLIALFLLPVLLVACTPLASTGGEPTPGATQAGDTPADSDLLLWERSGGFAGICQYLTISRQGAYSLVDCKENQTLAEGQLPQTEKDRLLGMVEKFGPSVWNSTNPPGSADMFNDSIKLYTTGSETPSEEQIEALNDYLSELVSNLVKPANS